MKKTLILMFLLLFSPLVLAQLEGSLTDTGGEGTYTIMIEDDNDGHVYNGQAVDLGNGRLRINVSDGLESYVGLGSEDEVGDYHFSLLDPRSGRNLDGVIDDE